MTSIKEFFENTDYEPLYIGFIYALIIALLMTIGEILFFRLYIVPDESKKIRREICSKAIELKEYIKEQQETQDIQGTEIPEIPEIPEVPENLKDIFNNTLKDIINQNNNLLNVMVLREDNLNQTINTDAITFIVILSLIFVFLIHLCHKKIKILPIWPIVLLAIISVVFIIGPFQIIMFRYAGGLNSNGYEYITPEEIEHTMYSKLKKDIFNEELKSQRV